MFIRPFFAVVFLAAVSGCATTGQKATTEQLQSRVVELEKKLEEKDSEIVDLQYEVKDLSSKVTTSATSPNSEENFSMTSDPVPVKQSEVVRVSATVEQVQTALKNANFYTGKIDGKAGPATKAAIMEFQRAKGLKADGIVGRKTWDFLRMYLQ